MNVRVLLVSALAMSACPAHLPSPEPGSPEPIGGGAAAMDASLDAGPDDAGLVLDAGAPFDAGSTIIDAGPIDTSPCEPITQQPVCSDGYCWVNPFPFAMQLTDVVVDGCHAWAAGAGGTLLERTDGGWLPHRMPTSETFTSFAAFAPDDVWLVGGSATLFHFDGRSWTYVLGNTSSATWSAAYAPSRGVVFIAGTDGIHRFENGTLTTVFAPPRTTFTGITGTSETNLRAVGQETIPNVDRPAVVYAFDGTTWTKEQSLTMVGLNRAITAGGTVYAAGKLNGHGPDYGYVAQLFPARSPLAFTQRATEFFDLAARSPTDVLVVGRGFSDSVLQFDGTTYRSVTNAPTAAFSGVGLGARDAFVVGDRLGRISNGTFVAESRDHGDTARSVLAFANQDVWLSGGRRSRQGGPFLATAPSTLWLGKVVGLDGNDLFATDSNQVWHFDGVAWAREPNGPGRVREVAVSSGGDVWAWDWSALWRRTSAGWRQVTLPLGLQVQDVSPLSSGAVVTGYTRATGNAVWVTDGTTFTERAVATDGGAFGGFSFVRGDVNDLYGVTTSGEVLHHDGTAWSAPLELDATFDLVDLAVQGSKVVIVGRNGRVGEWTGMRFAIRSIGSNVNLWTVSIDSLGRTWLGGEGAAVLMKP
ncbi:MAG: hypothetical protein GQE15_33250 [Archangiaceae bacterium]|nr:hypothetical protein [Archangiaceae bacterium]